jgi:hypothetical protein
MNGSSSNTLDASTSNNTPCVLNFIGMNDLNFVDTYNASNSYNILGALNSTCLFGSSSFHNLVIMHQFLPFGFISVHL